MKETDLPKPVSPYGVSKLAAENLCYLYWKNHGVPTIALRYFTVYGPRQRLDMAFHKFLKAIHEDKKIEIYGDGKQTRDFTYVADIVEASLLVAKSSIEGEIFNIGGGSIISLREAINILEELVGKEAELKYVEEQKDDVRDTFADISKAKKKLNYSPKVSIDKGLENFIEWFKVKQAKNKHL